MKWFKDRLLDLAKYLVPIFRRQVGIRVSTNLATSDLEHGDAVQMFVEEMMELVELISLRGALVGLPGVDSLLTEQRKRLTITVKLVANPSIIFMDEPTSGLDAKAAAIVMRAVRNTVDTGSTVVCAIHQPSIDIFEASDESHSTLPSKERTRLCRYLNYEKLTFEVFAGIARIEIIREKDFNSEKGRSEQ